uniref:Gnk2-homologous domain-containing protein n=1 Tax=Oryza punctata TaxID=4537 RepID=A0A0E0KC03_ORYPU
MAFISSKVCRCLVLVTFALLPLSMAMDSLGSYCSGNSLAGNSKAVASINSVLTDLVTKGSTDGGFATSSAGKGNSNVIYGLAQCRGDVSTGDCQACLASAANQILTSCNYQSDSRIWYDFCFMRYENENFIGQADTDAGVIMVNVQAMDNGKTFQKAVGKVMSKATAQVTQAGSGGLGRVKDQYTPFVNIYGFAQCTRDLSPLTCAQCLSTAVSRFGQNCGAQQGCRILYSSCMVRYEIYPFYFPLATSGSATTDMTKYTKIIVHR